MTTRLPQCGRCPTPRPDQHALQLDTYSIIERLETWRTCDVAKVPKPRLISLVWRDAGIRWQLDSLSESKSQSALGDRSSAAVIFIPSTIVLRPSNRRMYCRAKAPLRLTVQGWPRLAPSQIHLSDSHRSPAQFSFCHLVLAAL